MELGVVALPFWRPGRPGRPEQSRSSWPPAVRKTPEKAPVLSAEEEMKTLVLPPGYRVQLVAKEPLVIDPIAIDFDADGRMWVLEMPGFMSEPNGANSREPINDVAVLEDTERRRRDGQAHGVRRQARAAARAQGARRRRARRRAAEPVADEGHQRRPEGGYEGPGQRFLRPRRRQHRAQRQQPVLGHRQHHLHVRARLAPALQERQVRDDPDAGARPVGRLDGRCRPHLPQRQRRAAVRGLRRGEVLRAQSQPGADARPLRSADLARGIGDLADQADARRQPRLPRSVLPARRQLA